jgi:hypothetical protein
MIYSNICIQDGTGMDSTRHRKKGAVGIPRSDSVGSASGRKFLAPTLSDPAARTDKLEPRASGVSVKKRTTRPPRKYYTAQKP